MDKETGYYFYNARHYDAGIGRFVTPDTVIDGEMSTQGWNRYAYVHNNPIRYKDPTGHSGASGSWEAEGDAGYTQGVYGEADFASFGGADSNDRSNGAVGDQATKANVENKLQKNNVESSGKKTGASLPKPLDNGFVDRGVEFVDIQEYANGSRDPVNDPKGQGFGPRKMKNKDLNFHRGQDYHSKVETKVGTVSDGEVIASTYDKDYGNMVQVKHGNGVITLYAHLSELNVRKGDSVKKGQVVGRSGNTGDAIQTSRTDRDRGEHLHFGIDIVNNGKCKAVDPQKFNWREFEANREKRE